MTAAEQRAIELLHGAGYAISTGPEYLHLRATVEAIPWQALLNLTQRPGVAVDHDMDSVAHFLNEHAPWVGKL
jgi:hypothetical protein